jgi:tRNA-2-methylthio-N6-dimethylallyladenosine synthase
MPKLHVITYGCQMNEYDSARVAGLLRDAAYEVTDSPEAADVILLNTCSIRERAEDKVFSQLGALRRLKHARPDLLIGVMGCMAQLQQGRIQERAPHVDLVFGSPAIARVGDLLARARSGARPVLDTGEGPLVKSRLAADPAPLRAFVTIMEGCDKHCTFCVVPTTRGRERSHPPEAVLGEIRDLAARGCREVTLLGQTVNAWGRDLHPPTDLAELLEQVAEIEGIRRIRFTTSNPYNLTRRLARAIGRVPKVVEYLHLPLQSGSDRILERMNRGYTLGRYLELIAELKAEVHEIALSTDIIVGFPGETDADFERTVEAVQTVGYDNVFAFRYSRRPGTVAAAMPDQIPGAVVAERHGRLLNVAGCVAAERSRALVGRVLPVLVDGASRKRPGEAAGRTRCNRVVNFDPEGRDLLGEVVPVLVTEALPHSLRGALAGQKAGPRVAAAQLAKEEGAPCGSR